MKNMLPLGSAIGIFGGGQLGRMLRIAALDLGFNCCIYSDKAGCCGFSDGSNNIVAPYTDKAALAKFVSRCHVITLEFENIPDSVFDDVHKIGKGKVPMRPGRRALQVSQDRRLEKEMAMELGISISDHWVIEEESDLEKKFKFPIILKTAKNGYDGKGQGKAENVETLRKLWNGFGQVPCVAEVVVDYDFECSVILARNEFGLIAHYPPFRNVHEGGILRETFWPMKNGKDISLKFSEQKAFAVATKIAEHLDVVGLLTVEFFFTKDGEMLFNEIAPRAHNSGHVTMGGAAYTSQFEQQVRTITGMPFGSTSPRKGGGRMVNILGDDKLYREEIQIPRSKVYWYGKQPRGDKQQKLGHVVRTRW